MNLLDYQKSGNALGATITPQPVFNPLRGLIPQVPSIKSILTQNKFFGGDAITKYTDQYSYDSNYIQSAFGYRYDLVTKNGVARFLGNIPNPYGSYEPAFHSSYDPFRQAIGSFPLAPGLDYGIDANYNIFYGIQYQLAGPAPFATYNPYKLHGLPTIYQRHVHFYTKRYTDVGQWSGFSGASTEAEMPNLPTEDMPLQHPSSVVHLPNPNIVYGTPYLDWRISHSDPIGERYKVFSYRKEQYIYLFGEVSIYAVEDKIVEGQIAPSLIPQIYDADVEYQLYCNATKLNFMSMFAGVLQKSDGIGFDYKNVNPNNPNNAYKKFDFTGDKEAAGKSAPSKYFYFDKVLFNFFPSTFSGNLNEFYDKVLIPNPVSSDLNSGYVFDESNFEKMNRTINRFSYEVLKNIESKVYSDVAIDVEPEVKNGAFLPLPPAITMDQGGPQTFEQPVEFQSLAEGGQTVKTSFPGGIPYNEEALANNPIFDPNSLQSNLLTANVRSVYNYLSTDWENVLQGIPETAIPPIFISQQQVEGMEGVTIAPTQDQLISDGKNSYAFTQLWEQATKCKSYMELNDFATSKGYGKHSKLIYVPNEKYLKDIEEAKINFPMYNEIEFDIYSNANKGITNVFRHYGISKSILGCLLSHAYAPSAAFEYLLDTTPDLEDVSQFIADAINTPGSEELEVFSSMLFRFNKAIASGVFSSLETGQQSTPDQNSYIFKALGLPSAGAAMAENFSPTAPDQVITLNLEKFYQYYIAANNAKQGLEPPEDYEQEEGFILKSPESYSEYYAEYGPPDTGADSVLANVAEDSTESYAVGMGSISAVQRYIHTKMPKINEILSKKPRYSEPFMYEIRKMVDQRVVQRIFIPHFSDPESLKGDLKLEPESPRIKKIKYIDTQVKYGEMYTYKIVQHRIVVGGDYRFVFSSNADTHRRAIAMGYPERYESDIIMRSGRNKHIEGKMLYDAVTPTGVQEGVPGLLPHTEQVPFMFYTKAPTYNPDPSYSYKGQGISNLKEYSINISDDYPINDIPDYFSGIGEDPHKIDRLQKLAIFKSMVYPNFNITSVPYYEQTVVVADFPPLPPNVNFDPQVGKGSTLLMTFENQVGDREEVPVIIEDYDEVMFVYQRLAQNREEKNGKGEYFKPYIRFKTDDFPKAYQIFVMDKPPSSYADFKSKMALELSVEDATAIQQSLVPNKKYYFTFRSVDIHGNISNPSMVYEVEMVFNSGVYYPSVSEYEFPKEIIGNKFKSFKQYAKIEASLIQKIVNKEASGISDQTSTLPSGEEPVLGVAPHSLWDQKKFKFRIISKHTGKVIDMNVKFKTNYTDSGIKGC